MKKLIIALMACGIGLSALAQVPARSYSFIPSGIKALVVTNTYAITNLATAGSWTTNRTGTTYTNSYNQQVILTNSSKNLLQDVPLWSLRDGSGAWSTGVTNGTGILYNQSYATLSITWYTGSAADTAATLVFTPVYNGRDEATASTEQWTIAFTPTVSSLQTLTTNVPLMRWPGAAALRCRRIVAGDTDASSALAITDLSINGFVPVGGQ